jgi:hypothetical protein
MGRFYNGDIEGKFWFGIQDSDDIINLVKVEHCRNYTWQVCYCVAEIDCDDYCKTCYESQEDHITDAIENELYESECLYYEECSMGYSLDKSTHYEELCMSMDKLKLEIKDEIINAFDKLEQNDNILDAMTGVFNDIHGSIKSVYNGNCNNSQLELIARYTLGYQIEYCLRTTDMCNINCEA